MADDGLWYKDAVFYELHVRSFQDGNGDGIGDFRGLTTPARITSRTWASIASGSCRSTPRPCATTATTSPTTAPIHPSYGTMDDFQAFLDAAHAAGLRVITDLVMNHTSDQHPWFQRADRSRPRARPSATTTSGATTDQKYADARIIFTDTEQSNWTWEPTAKAYYWHRFFRHQPDLNFDNPLVREAILDVFASGWSKGLDGFRCDAVPYLFEREGTNCENLPETHDYLKHLRAELDRRVLRARSCWPRPTSGRRTSAPTSATATSSRWPSTSR